MGAIKDDCWLPSDGAPATAATKGGRSKAYSASSFLKQTNK